VRRMQVRMKLAVALFVLVLGLGLSPCRASEGLKVRVWTDKDQFLLHEPIPVHYEVTNTSDSITFSPNFYETEEHFNITDEKGRGYHSHIRGLSMAGNPFPPGQVHRSTLDVHALHDVEDVGDYTCYIPVWTRHACLNSERIKSNTIKFKVVAPTGEDEKALNLLLEAEKLAGMDSALGYPHPGKEELALKKYEEVANTYPNSVYAPMALLAAVEVHARWYEHRRQVIPVCRWLVERYPDYYYWAKGFSRLVEAYELLRDKEGALKTMQELAEKHPGTKIAQKAKESLEKIDQWEFD
jgi:hypothetical protein